jgi:hypothetical protein
VGAARAGRIGLDVERIVVNVMDEQIKEDILRRARLTVAHLNNTLPPTLERWARGWFLALAEEHAAARETAAQAWE